jgi:hypothetical protein
VDSKEVAMKSLEEKLVVLVKLEKDVQILKEEKQEEN